MNEKYSIITEKDLEEVQTSKGKQQREGKIKSKKKELDDWAKKAIQILIQYGYLAREEIEVVKIKLP